MCAWTVFAQWLNEELRYSGMAAVYLPYSHVLTDWIYGVIYLTVLYKVFVL